MPETKLFTGAWRACHIELEPLETQNAETPSVFLKSGEYIENEELLLNLPSIEVFFLNGKDT